MSRISSSVRSRYTTRSPSEVVVAEVWQHSQTRLSSTASGPSAPSAAMVVCISAMSPSPSSGALRPSSQMAFSCPLGPATSETNPCSLFTLSRCGTTGLLQVAPPSCEKAMLTSYASVPGSLLPSQCAASVPSDKTVIDGKSASLTNQLVPPATIRGSAHLPLSSRTENINL